MTVTKKHAKPVKQPEPNKLFPGRPNYTGPKDGSFAMLHHRVLFEKAQYDGVMERVEYVRTNKPSREKRVRLRNMMYLGGCPEVQALTALRKVCCLINNCSIPGASMTSSRLSGIAFDFEAIIRPVVLAYIKKLYPRHSWNEDAHVIRGTEHTA